MMKRMLLAECMMKRMLLAAGLFIVGACSSDADAVQDDLLRSTGGGPAAGAQSVAGASSPATAGTTAASGGRPTAGVSAAGSPAAGTGLTGAISGTGAAGAAGSGAGGQLAAGTGTAGDAAGAAGATGAAGAAGATGAAGAAGAAGPGGNTPGTVTVEFTTLSYDGEYAPLNYGAVWFEKPGMQFVKTAKRWAGATHAGDLVGWNKASGGWGSVFGGGGNMADMMDAMSSATLRTHQKHTVMWNMKDAQKQLVPDGDYVAVLEMTESRARDQAGPLVRIPFKKGPEAQMVEVPATASFTGVVLRYTP